VSLLLLVELTLLLLMAGHVYGVWTHERIKAALYRRRTIAELQAWIDERAEIQRTEHEGVEDPEWAWVPCGQCGGQRRIVGPHPDIPGKMVAFLCGKCMGLGLDMHPPADAWPTSPESSGEPDPQTP